MRHTWVHAKRQAGDLDPAATDTTVKGREKKVLLEMHSRAETMPRTWRSGAELAHSTRLNHKAKADRATALRRVAGKGGEDEGEQAKARVR